MSAGSKREIGMGHSTSTSTGAVYYLRKFVVGYLIVKKQWLSKI